MAVTVTLTIESRSYYVVAITKGRDAVNEFFEFHLTIRHEFESDIPFRLAQLAVLEITDTEDHHTLTYTGEIVFAKINIAMSESNSNEVDKLLNIQIRPKGWQVLNHKAVRLLEVSDEEEDPVNYSFPVLPTTEDINRILNISGFEAESGWVETLADADLYSFRLDWWQNQLGFQIQETNAQLFSRLVWKLGASFIYAASQTSHLWLIAADICPVPGNRKVLEETKVSRLSIQVSLENRFSRWHRDQLDQINRLSVLDDKVELSDANYSEDDRSVSHRASVPISCDQPFDYRPARKSHAPLTINAVEVNHVFDHRHGYYADVVGILSAPDEYFDFSVLDAPPPLFTIPVIATAHSTEGGKWGDRDSKMRYQIRFDFEKTVDEKKYFPTGWLYRMQPDVSLSGGGDYSALPHGVKVMVQMVNGDREQPVIVGTFVTKRRSIV